MIKITWSLAALNLAALNLATQNMTKVPSPRSSLHWRCFHAYWFLCIYVSYSDLPVSLFLKSIIRHNPIPNSLKPKNENILSMLSLLQLLSICKWDFIVIILIIKLHNTICLDFICLDFIFFSNIFMEQFGIISIFS